ncbi:hypothetical protein THTE_2583 [Thermogutta terrifontis]|uniref:Uncharacterized protein n=1 Tax=Thermogutta terrifontis TaxID=1331910 RepID=A0A286RGT4_9BACT|nr:hypothetical protein THTE_2583 [Thermogutta terrifontis]
MVLGRQWAHPTRPEPLLPEIAKETNALFRLALVFATHWFA